MEEISSKLNNMPLSGANLGTKNNVSFQLISKQFNLSPEQLKIIQFWERNYLGWYERLKNNEFPINLIPVEDGKVEINPGQPFHRASASISSLYGISIAGVVASEWFGVLESEGEAYFCTFLNTLHEELLSEPPSNLDSEQKKEYLRKQTASIKNRNNAFSHSPYIKSVTLFFDGNNPLMKFLMKLDFFEYLKIRKENPKKIEQLYDKRIIALFEKVCFAESMSFSSSFHNENDYERKTWLAIPMGIPPMLINGVCINTKASPELIERVDEIARMFPNAVIFNENKEVLHYSLLNENQKTIF